MNAYTKLAEFYDILTSDVPYGAYADFYESIFSLSGAEVGSIVDLGCGTGSLTLELASRGYSMIGVDSSHDMLTIAAQKSVDETNAPVFICQSIEELDLYGTADAMVCALDVFNYLTIKQIQDTLHRVKLFLTPGGVLIFDINTPFKLRGLDDCVFLDETDELLCVWRTAFEEASGVCRYGIDIFSASSGMWRRDREEHVQYAHEPDRLKALLKQEGFCDISFFGDLKKEPPGDDEQRIFIYARTAR